MNVCQIPLTPEEQVSKFNGISVLKIVGDEGTNPRSILTMVQFVNLEVGGEGCVLLPTGGALL